jgi:hypothetical protein
MGLSGSLVGDLGLSGDTEVRYGRLKRNLIPHGIYGSECCEIERPDLTDDLMRSRSSFRFESWLTFRDGEEWNARLSVESH